MHGELCSWLPVSFRESWTVLQQYWNCQSHVYSQRDDQPNQFYMPQNDNEMFGKSNNGIYSNNSTLAQIIVTIYTDLLMNTILQMPEPASSYY